MCHFAQAKLELPDHPDSQVHWYVADSYILAEYSSLTIKSRLSHSTHYLYPLCPHLQRPAPPLNPKPQNPKPYFEAFGKP